MEKREFYTKLLAKLQKIKNGEMTLDFYINEVTEKLNLPRVVESGCECDIPYFPTGNIHWCSKCNKETMY